MRKTLRVVRTTFWLDLVRRVDVAPWAACQGRLPAVRGNVHIGRGFSSRASTARIRLEAGPGGRLDIGEHVFVNEGVTVYAASSVRIGSHVRLADDATVYDTDFHPVRPDSPVRVASVVIEDGAWIGARAIVLPGVTVGRHSVVAAGAVVVADVPPRSVVAGNPARVVSTFECADDWVRP